jgi:hypothetical protein
LVMAGGFCQRRYLLVEHKNLVCMHLAKWPNATDSRGELCSRESLIVRLSKRIISPKGVVNEPA